MGAAVDEGDHVARLGGGSVAVGISLRLSTIGSSSQPLSGKYVFPEDLCRRCRTRGWRGFFEFGEQSLPVRRPGLVYNLVGGLEGHREVRSG